VNRLTKILKLWVPKSFIEIVLEKVVGAKFRSGCDCNLSFKKLLSTDKPVLIGIKVEERLVQFLRVDHSVFVKV
jgi:hypothetical protein